METDIYMTLDGDIEVGSNGDLKLSRGADELLQGIMFRCKTVAGDFLLQPMCGADLETLIGAPNNRSTGQDMEYLILNALTHDGFLAPTDVSVSAVPTGPNKITAVIILTVDEQPTRLLASLDLVEGEVVLTR
jgi:hypothetical protein